MLMKYPSNDPKCTELGWLCVPMVVETYGKGTIAIISSVASRRALHMPKSIIVYERYGWLNLNLICANATVVLSRIVSPP